MNEVLLILCILAAACAGICVFYICIYLNIDEKDLIKRLLAIKNHEHNIDRTPDKNAFIKAKSSFQFEALSKFLDKFKITEEVGILLERAGVPLQVDTFFIIVAVFGLIPLITAILSGNILIAVLCPIAIAIPVLHLRYLVKQKTLLFTQQLPDALDLLSNALRAGHSLFSALGVIVKEMPSPINKVFKVLTDEIALGVDVKDAMKSLQDSMPDSIDLRFFTTVIILQREIGGNLIKLLDVLSNTIRERFKMIGQIKAQTMQAKLSGIIVSLVPPIIGIILYVMAPDYMSYLINDIRGKIALFGAIVLMIVGFIIMKKITDIEV